jgi:hypothetical protein
MHSPFITGKLKLVIPHASERESKFPHVHSDFLNCQRLIPTMLLPLHQNQIDGRPNNSARASHRRTIQPTAQHYSTHHFQLKHTQQNITTYPINTRNIIRQTRSALSRSKHNQSLQQRHGQLYDECQRGQQAHHAQEGEHG